jgi:4-hydroxy-4-methyl-2-oxoglutarate aldolase
MSVQIHPTPTRFRADELAPWREIPVAVAVDHGVAQIDPAIRPLRPAGLQPRLFGRAVTAYCEPPDFGAVLNAIDHVGPGDVLVIAAGGDAVTAMIGEILCGQLRRRGGVGVVCEGAVRDVATIAGIADFAVFSRFVTPRGPTAAAAGAVNVPVIVGGAHVAPGDVILGDDDGLAVLTPETARHCLAASQAKVAREAEWIAALEAGRSMKEVFGLQVP